MSARIFLHQIAAAVAREWGHPAPVLRGSRGKPDVVQARHAGIWLGRRLTARSLGTIAQHFGSADHSTAVSACEHIERDRRVDAMLDTRLNRLELALRAHALDRAVQLEAQAA